MAVAEAEAEDRSPPPPMAPVLEAAMAIAREGDGDGDGMKRRGSESRIMVDRDVEASEMTAEAAEVETAEAAHGED